MNSRERVIATLNHKEPDKMPIDCGGTIVSTISRTPHNAIKKLLGINSPQEPITNPIIDTVVPCPELLEKWQVDFRRVAMKAPSSLDEAGDDSQSFQATSAATDEKPIGFEFADEFGTIWRKAQYDFCPVDYVMKEFELDDLKEYKWPDPYDSGRVEGLEEEAKALYENTDFAITADIMCGGPFEQACWIREYATFLVDLYVNPKFAHTLLDMITDYDIGLWDAYLDKVGLYVQVVAQGDDIGMQDREYMSPELYKEFIYPRHKRLYDFIHSKTKAKIFMHTCGSVRKLIPYFIEAGIDILNPIQYVAKDMGLEGLKKDFGSELCFWGGGISTQIIPEYSLQDIEDVIKKNLDILMPGGGYVFSPTHNIQFECPPEATIKIYDSAVKYRNY